MNYEFGLVIHEFATCSYNRIVGNFLTCFKTEFVNYDINFYSAHKAEDEIIPSSRNFMKYITCSKNIRLHAHELDTVNI